MAKSLASWIMRFNMGFKWKKYLRSVTLCGIAVCNAFKKVWVRQYSRDISSMENQAAIQAILESHNYVENTTEQDEDEDVYQCGKCKKQFTSIQLLVNHKQSRCTIAVVHLTGNTVQTSGNFLSPGTQLAPTMTNANVTILSPEQSSATLTPNSSTITNQMSLNNLQTFVQPAQEITIATPTGIIPNSFNSVSIWKAEHVRLMLALYAEHRDKFSDASYKSKDIWNIIASQMRENGYSFSGFECDKKFRNMKHRYKIIKDNNRTSDRRKWGHFEAMDNLFADDSFIQPVSMTTSKGKLEVTDEMFVEEQVIQPASMMSSSKVLNWKTEHVRLMLALYAEHRDKFSQSSYKSKDIWNLIASQMRDRGYPYTGFECDKKFRNMKHRYKLIKQNNGTSDRDRTRWEHFEAMDNLFTEMSPIHAVDIMTSSKRKFEVMDEEMFTEEIDPAMRPVTMISSSKVQTKMRKYAACLSKRPSLPDTVPSTSSCEETTAEYKPSCKKQKTKSEPPSWFLSYVEKNDRQFKEMMEVNQKLLKCMQERNDILKKIHESLV